MLTDQELDFIDYWEKNRERNRLWSVRLLKGLQPALIFTLPVILLLISVWFLLPDWYAKVSKTSPAMLISAIVALGLVVVFFAFFKTQYDWEKQDQIYQELIEKRKRQKNN
jgi:hypothetical protein